MINLTQIVSAKYVTSVDPDDNTNTVSSILFTMDNGKFISMNTSFAESQEELAEWLEANPPTEADPFSLEEE